MRSRNKKRKKTRSLTFAGVPAEQAEAERKRIYNMLSSSNSLTIAATSDIGRKRKNNEDCYGCFTADRFGRFVAGGVCSGGSDRMARRGAGGANGQPGPTDSFVANGGPDVAPEVLAVVCDGMGGAAGGEVASALGVGSMERSFRAFAEKAAQNRAPSVDASVSPSSAAGDRTAAPTKEVAVAPNEAALYNAAIEADKAVWDAALKEPALHGMGATLSALWIAGGRYAIAQVGDSRVYRWRKGALAQLTEDQTVLNRLMKEGKVPENPTIAARFKSTLEQALGSEPGLLKPVMQSGETAEGDLFLLCSDGLYEGLDGEALAAFLRRHAGRMPLAELSAKLVRESVERAGRDNTTAVLIAVGEVPASGGIFSRFW